MKQDNTKKNIITLGLCTLIGTMSLLTDVLFPSINHYINGLIIILCAILIYFAIVFGAAQRNWLDIRALFSGVWLGTIGLAALRLADYQEPWQDMTWGVLAVAFIAFVVGSSLGIAWGHRIYNGIKRRFPKIQVGRIRFKLQENRLFLICIITTLIGLACFIINIIIRGYIPCFSDSTTAYTDFYTKFHIFSTAATGVSGLCFYCIRTQPLRLWKKILLGLCIFYLVFIFPIMVVSRGIFIVAALSLVASVFYTCGKRFWALVMSIVVVLGVYLFTSTLRNYTDQQLSTIFQPSEITRPTSPDENLTDTDDTDDTDDPDKDSINEDSINEDSTNNDSTVIFQLSPRMAFLYGYVTVSHDNLNEAVQNTENYTWGVRQLVPFNVVLRSDWINQANANAEHHFVEPNLNTTNLIGDFYYDFGWIGVLLFMLFWPFVFGLIQGAYEKSKNPFILLLLGNALSPVVLCFFACWMSNFTFWMFWGVAILLALAAYVPLRLRK